jgi:hypothetical protein
VQPAPSPERERGRVFCDGGRAGAPPPPTDALDEDPVSSSARCTATAGAVRRGRTRPGEGDILASGQLTVMRSGPSRQHVILSAKNPGCGLDPGRAQRSRRWHCVHRDRHIANIHRFRLRGDRGPGTRTPAHGVLPCATLKPGWGFPICRRLSSGSGLLFLVSLGFQAAPSPAGHKGHPDEASADECHGEWLGDWGGGALVGAVVIRGGNSAPRGLEVWGCHRTAGVQPKDLSPLADCLDLRLEAGAGLEAGGCGRTRPGASMRAPVRARPSSWQRELLLSVTDDSYSTSFLVLDRNSCPRQPCVEDATSPPSWHPSNRRTRIIVPTVNHCWTRK